MAFTINGSLVIDETSGTQNAADQADSTGNDVADGLGALSTEVPQFDALLSAVVTSGTPINVAVSNGSADNSAGTALLTGFGADVVDLAFTNGSGGPLAGEYAKFGAGVGDFLLTAQGRKICLYSYAGSDLQNVDENNVVFGRQANADGTPNANGTVVFAAYLQPTDSSGAVQTSDVDAYGAKVWMVEYEPLQHGITGTTFAAYDDARTLTDPLYVTVGTRSEFSLEGAPSGQNLFLAFGDGTPTTTETTIIVTADNAANQSGDNAADTADDISITTGGTVNTGQGGGGTTLGHTNQMVDPGEGLYFTFVTGADPTLTVPNLDQNEADLETNIQFTNLFNSYGASFAVVQTQGDSEATVKLTALTTAVESGASFLDGVGEANGDGPVQINWIKVETFAKSGNKLLPDAEHVFTAGGTDPATGVSVTFNGDGTVELTGVQANDVVSYRTGNNVIALPHQRVLIENTGNPVPNASTTNASFDIGKFSLINANTDTDAFQALAFQDDGPGVTVSVTNEASVLLTTQDAETDGDPTASDTASTTADFSGAFSAVPVYGADGAGSTVGSYALSLYGTNGGASGLSSNGAGINLYDVAGVIVGSTAAAAGDISAGNTVFSISVGAATGVVTLTQDQEIDHPIADDPTPTASPFDDQLAVLAAGLVKLTGTATTTDGDGDTATHSQDVDLGGNVRFADDGPGVTVSVTNEASVLLTTQDAETDGDPTASDTASTTADFSGAFSAVPVYGADGAGSTVGSYALSLYGTNGGASGLSSNGAGINLYDVAGVIVGSTAAAAGDISAGNTVFSISVGAATGVVTLTQDQEIDHPIADDPTPTASPFDDQLAVLAAGLVKLTGTATTTDGDGDTATHSQDVDLGGNVRFADDGPSMSTSGTLPVLTVDETVLATNATGDFSSNFSALFGADGMGATLTSYALAAGSEGMDSLLVDTASGHNVFLRTEAGVVVGREGTNATDAIGGDIVFTVSVSSAGVVTLDQQRAVVHDDPLDPDESTSPATLAAGMVILTGTATDGDGDTASAALNIGDRLNFEDDGPSLTVGNLVGTGTVLPQIGYWSGSFGNDGPGAAALDIALTGFTLVRPDSTTTPGTFSFNELAGSPDGTGAYLFGGTLTGDFDNNAGTANTSVDFTLTAYANGSYALDLVQGFSSTVTTSTASGGLGAGGPDAIQTLYIPPPPATPLETVVFFSAKPLASDADILTGIGSGLTDPTELQLETPPVGGYIDPRSMNVSTSGIGVDNNLLQGYDTSAIQDIDESFVVNPKSLVNSVQVFVDNSVSGYGFTGGERLYYKVFYEDGTDSDNILVESDLGLKSQANSFTVSGGGKMIDAVQLTMAIGEVKIPEIRFTTLTENLANDVQLDFSATVTDKDGDTAVDLFSANLFANEITGAFDFVLTGGAGAQDAFDIDLATTMDQYQVSGFDTATDKLVLIGDATAAVTNIDNSGADSIVTITETGAQVTTVTVVGVDLLASHIAFG